MRWEKGWRKGETGDEKRRRRKMESGRGGHRKRTKRERAKWERGRREGEQREKSGMEVIKGRREEKCKEIL